MLVIHTQSFSDPAFAEALRKEAEAHGVPILSEDLFLSDSIQPDVLQTVSPDTLPDSVFELPHIMKDSMVHEDFMYDWLARILNVQDVSELDGLLSEIIFYDSFLCLNHNILDLILHDTPPRTESFSEKPIVISSQPAGSGRNISHNFLLSDMVPQYEEWLEDSSAYILGTVHADKKIYGYYALRTEDFSSMSAPFKRVISALNLAFRIVPNRFRHTDMSLSLKQAMLTDNDKHLPLNLLIEKNLFFYHFQPIAEMLPIGLHLWISTGICWTSW